MSKIYALLLVGCTFGLHASDKEVHEKLLELGVLSEYADYCRYVVKVSKDKASIETSSLIRVHESEKRSLVAEKSALEAPKDKAIKEHSANYDKICDFFHLVKHAKQYEEEGQATKESMWVVENDYSDED